MGLKTAHEEGHNGQESKCLNDQDKSFLLISRLETSFQKLFRFHNFQLRRGYEQYEHNSVCFPNDFSLKRLIAGFQSEEQKKKTSQHEINFDCFKIDLLDHTADENLGR